MVYFFVCFVIFVAILTLCLGLNNEYQDLEVGTPPLLLVFQCIGRETFPLSVRCWLPFLLVLPCAWVGRAALPQDFSQCSCSTLSLGPSYVPVLQEAFSPSFRPSPGSRLLLLVTKWLLVRGRGSRSHCCLDPGSASGRLCILHPRSFSVTFSLPQW